MFRVACLALVCALLTAAHAGEYRKPWPQPRCLAYCKTMPFWKYNAFELNHAMSDNFYQYAGRPNPKKWIVHDPPNGIGHWDGRQPGFCQRDNVWVEKPVPWNYNGLAIRAKAWWKSGWRYNQIFRTKPKKGPNRWKTPESRGYNTYTTGMVSSKKALLYGYFEVEARTMMTQMVNAFWFSSRIGDKWTEIDVFENSHVAKWESKWNVDMRPRSIPNAHFYDEPTMHIDTEKLFTLRPPHYTHHQPISWKSHTYGLLWTPRQLVWFFDGKPFVSRKNRFWHQPMFVRFDAETNFKWHGILPDVAKLNKAPRVFSIHYFRVFNINWGKKDKHFTPNKWWRRQSGITLRGLQFDRATSRIAGHIEKPDDISPMATEHDAMVASKACEKVESVLARAFDSDSANFTDLFAAEDLHRAPYQGEEFGKPVKPPPGMTWDDVIRKYTRKTYRRGVPKRGSERHRNYLLDVLNWAHSLYNGGTSK